MRRMLFSFRVLTWLALFAAAGNAGATSFALLLQGGDGTETEQEGVREVDIDDLVIDIREMTTGLDVEYRQALEDGYRLYAPGKAHFGNARITLEPGGNKELYAWWQEAARGKNIRKNITVVLFKSDKSPGRSYNLLDCFPTQWSVQESDDGVIEAETLTVNIGRIEFSTQVAGDVGGTDNGPVTTTLDNTGEAMHWASWGGGEPQLILVNAVGSDQYHTTTPGHKTVGEITLRGAMTASRRELDAWINETIQGKPWKRTMVVTEPGRNPGARPQGRSYTYGLCFPTRYVFPRMSVTNTTGNVMEEVSVKPIRVELR